MANQATQHAGLKLVKRALFNKLQMLHQFAPGSDREKFVGGVTQWFEKQVLDEKFSLDQDVAINSNPVDFTNESILPDGNSTKVRTISTNGDKLTANALCLGTSPYQCAWAQSASAAAW
jgi:hypothetical protein